MLFIRLRQSVCLLRCRLVSKRQVRGLQRARTYVFRQGREEGSTKRSPIMPPKTVRKSPAHKSARQALPEASKVPFLLEAAHMLAETAPAVSRQLGKRVLQARFVCGERTAALHRVPNYVLVCSSSPILSTCRHVQPRASACRSMMRCGSAVGAAASCPRRRMQGMLPCILWTQNHAQFECWLKPSCSLPTSWQLQSRSSRHFVMGFTHRNHCSRGRVDVVRISHSTRRRKVRKLAEAMGTRFDLRHKDGRRGPPD